VCRSLAYSATRQHAVFLFIFFTVTILRVQVIGVVAPYDNIQQHLARFLSRPQLFRHESSYSRHELYGHELSRHQHSNGDLSFARKRSLSKEVEEEEESNPHVAGQAFRVRGGGGGKGDRGEIGVGDRVEGGFRGTNAVGLVKCEGEVGGGGGRGEGRGGGGRGERGGGGRGDVHPLTVGKGGRRRKWSKAVAALAFQAFSDSESDGV
jgi:hypothetical protein